MSIPSGNHKDWIWPFKLIPRSFNARESMVPPYQVAGSKGTYALDIPFPGAWVLARSKDAPGFNFALTTKGQWHFRIGTWRYDYVDHYYTFPTFTIKRLGP